CRTTSIPAELCDGSAPRNKCATVLDSRSHPSTGYRRNFAWPKSNFDTSIHFLVVADGHAGRGFNGFCGNEFCRVSFEFVDAVDKGGAVNGFGCVGERGRGGPLL